MKLINILVFLFVMTSCNLLNNKNDSEEAGFRELLTRDFLDNNGTLLSDVNNENDWQVNLSNSSDSLVVQDNMILATRQNTSSPFAPIAIFKTPITQSNIEVSVDFEVKGGDIAHSEIEAFVILRANSTNIASTNESAYFCGFQASNTLQVMKTTAGTNNLTVLSSSSTTVNFNNNDEFEIELIQDGSSIICRVFQPGSGTVVTTFNDPDRLTGQFVGFSFGNLNDSNFLYADDFEIEIK